jgi:hypothetical protein
LLVDNLNWNSCIYVSAHRKGSIRKKELPVQGSRILAKLFQEAWKKGAEVEQVNVGNLIWTRLIPKVVGSIPTVARHIFQVCPVWIYTQSNITQASYSPEYITPTQQNIKINTI